MNLRKLKVFLHVSENRNMSETARKLYMTQPAVSQVVAELEDELNVKLFERINRKLLLTYPGEILQSYSKRIINLVDEAQHTLQDIVNMNIGNLRIGASTTIGTYLLPKIISEFNRTFKDINTPFVVDNTGVIEELILDNKIDIGLVEGPVHSKDIIIKPFFDDQLYLICSSYHQWAQKTIIEGMELENEGLIIREKGSGTREVFENTMASHKLPYNIKHVLNNTEAIKKSVEANVAVTVISKTAIREELKQGSLIKVDIEGVSFERKFNIIYHKDKYHQKLMDEFINFCYELPNFNLGHDLV